MNKRIFSVLVSGVLLAAFVAAPAGDALAKKKKKAPPVCAAYSPGELGAGAETVVVTDGHTADAPLVVPITLGPAFDEGVLEAVGAGETPRAFVNVQVDSAAATSGLYATFEFQTHRDYDFWAVLEPG